LSRLQEKHVVVGVTGGIAAYKACELVRRLDDRGAIVTVVMTEGATEFVTPLTFEALTRRPVAVDTFAPGRESSIGHIDVADRADLVVVAPATANTLAKAAAGVADNMLLTVLLAARCPMVFCPAMNVNMYTHPAVQRNISTLRSWGRVLVVEPGEGELACGWEGLGRLAEPEDIVDWCERALADQDMAGERVLVTAGATREYIDPVRFISNPSTGKMGFAMAREAWLRGAEVVVIAAHTEASPPPEVEVVRVTDARAMREAVLERLEWASVVVKAAAVGDWTPAERGEEKMEKRKGGETMELRLVRTDDILAEVGRRKGERFVVGFAAETGNPKTKAARKLRDKNADLMVANDVTLEGAGFGSDTNAVWLIKRGGKAEQLPLMDKRDVARRVFDRVVEMKRKKHK